MLPEPPKKVLFEIYPNESEEQVKIKFEIAQRNMVARKLSGVIERGHRLVREIVIDREKGVFTWGSGEFPTMVEDQRKKCEKLPPKQLKGALVILKEEYERTTHYVEHALEHAEESLCSNYLQLYPSKEAAIEAKLDKSDVQTVARYGEHLLALIEVAEEVLTNKLAFVAEHVHEVPKIITRANKAVDEASKIKPRVFELLKKGFELSDKEVRTLIKLVRKHQELQRDHDQAVALLFKYAPDNPTKGLNSFPSPDYHLPYWIQKKLNGER
jgi:hypothetical protein